MARILRQATVARDGMHNAFTDLAFWQGQYCVSYRKGSAHASMDGEAVLAVSVDRARFREVAHVKVPGDNRDPKLVPMSDERMAMIFPTWISGARDGRLQQYVAFSGNGYKWDKPVPILGENRWLWRVRALGDRFYGLCYGWRPGTPREERIYYQELLYSKDMLSWDTVAQIGTDDMKLGESDALFMPDGEAWVVSRSSADPGYSYFSCAKPPYTEWENTRLDYLIHSPVMLEHDGTVYVSGRRIADLEGDSTWPFLSRASLGVWSVTRGAVEPVMHIPASGDCSYPGLIKDPEGRICMTYYSQHAYDAGVVDFQFRREAAEPFAQGDILAPSDVYFAELQLP